MSPELVGVFGIAIALCLMALRVPIAIALGSVSVVGIFVLRGQNAAFGALQSLPFDFATNWTLAAIPMFLLMGSLSYQSGLTASLYSAARVWLGGVPGGLAVATTFASAGFAAASGSSVATSAAMGRVAIPEMLQHNYDKGLAAGSVAAAGTLGALIPPSIAFVIYGWYTEQSVSALLIAGILPGILTAVAYATMIIIRCKINPELAPGSRDKPRKGERLDTLLRVWPMPLLIMAIIGSIYTGVATPSESAAVGTVAAAVIAFLQGRLNSSVLRDSVSDAVATTASLFFIAVGAVLLTRFLALAGIPTAMSSFLVGMAADPFLVILALSVVFLVLGMFLDPMGLMLLVLPIFLPAFKALGIDLIWMGVIVVKYIEIGLITPPVGMNAFVVKSVVGNAIPLTTIFRGLGWFIACEIVVVGLLLAFPQISLWLPGLMR